MAASQLLNSSYYIPLAFLAAFLLIFTFKKYLWLNGAWVGILASFYALLHSGLIAYGVYSGVIDWPKEGLQGRFFEIYTTWFSVGNFDFQAGVLIDGLSSLMLVVVTLISFLIQVYSLGYMQGHKRFGLYYSYLNLFSFSMILLVMANNLLQFFVGWELVGLCSYLLIGFDFEREPAAYAGRKAFITTKIADLGFYLALLIIFNLLGTFNIPILSQNLATMSYPGWAVKSIPLLLFIGAAGKSAQIPFHVWLPDAMEGPTPVSALIHAATMVAAGVYMVARLFFIFQMVPFSLEVIGWVGVITAVVSASMGLVSSDIKRVLAFSTVSQLGFMMAGLGCGGYTAGMFHLTTHAAFKALLFLGAGSVIHAVHTNDIWKMGGLRTKMPLTAFTFLIGTFAIAGFPLMSGFFSKDDILLSAFHHDVVIFGILLFTSALTSFYMFRLLILVFFGDPRDKGKFNEAQESPLVMTFPLVVLAFLSLFLGAFLSYNHNVGLWYKWGDLAADEENQNAIMAFSSVVFVIGWLLAFWIYNDKAPKYNFLRVRYSFFHNLLSRKFYFDEVYLWFIRSFVYPTGAWLAKFDFDYLDQKIVDGVGLGGRGLALLSRLLDDGIVDRFLVNGNGIILSRVSNFIRRWQDGLAQSYLFWMAIGLVSMFLVVAWPFIK